jgi:hypothetical protein
MLVELLFRQEAEFSVRLAQRDAFVMRGFRQFRGLVVTDVLIQWGHQHW